VHEGLNPIVFGIQRGAATSVKAYFDIKPSKEGSYQYKNYTYDGNQATNNAIHMFL